MIQRKLHQWQQANLLSREQVEQILAFEQNSHRPYFLYCVIGLGALSIGIGMIAIIAANYYKIPYSLKLAGALVTLSALGLGLVLSAQGQRKFLFELFLALFFALQLAFVGLLGQIYHTNSPTYVGLVFWLAISLPVMLYAQSNFLVWIWGAGVCATIASLYESHPLSMMLSEQLPVSYFVLIPAFSFLILEQLLKRVELYRAVCRHFGWLFLLLSLSIWGIVFPHLVEIPEFRGGDLMLVSLVILCYAAWIRFSTVDYPNKVRNELCPNFVYECQAATV